MENNELTTKEQISYIILGLAIASIYTGLFIIFTSIDYDQIKIIPEADAQIEPFELQLEQIRNPEECTRRVVQGKSAEIPFSMKVFYDTTRNSALEFKQQGTSFPLTQRTNQVMTFYTNGTDQYEIYLEVNYDDRKERQVYLEYLSGNEITQSEQIKFSVEKFCTTIFVNTILPISIPTKEEIFGESLDYIAQIPAMVTAFNANTITSNTNIAYVWMLALGTLIMVILIFISSHTGKRKFDSRIKDLDDTIEEANKMTIKIGSLETTVEKPLGKIQKMLEAMLLSKQVTQLVPQKEKPSAFAKIIPFGRKKQPEPADVVDRPRTESDEVLEALQPTKEEIKEEKMQEPTGGYVLQEEEIDKIIEQVVEPKEANPMKLRPQVFMDIVNAIDYQKKAFKEGMFEKFSYNELNESYGWIVKYRMWMDSDEREIPPDKLERQGIIEKIIYEAIFRKMEKYKREPRI